jgi:hypothetical protein
MNKNKVNYLAAGSTAGFGIVSKNRQKAANRLITILLMIALLVPVFLFSPTRQTQAQNRLNLPIQPTFRFPRRLNLLPLQITDP